MIDEEPEGGNGGDPIETGANESALSLQAAPGKVKHSEVFRFLATVPIIIGLAFALWYPLPNSNIKQRVPGWWVPATELFGLQQNWAMFSPDPPQLTLDVEAIVTDAAGKKWLVNVPRPNPAFSSVYSERYRKWEERIYPVLMNGEWPNAARWFAARAEDQGIKPVTVELQRTWTMTDLPGIPPDPVPKHFVFFTWDVASATGTNHDPELNPAVNSVDGASSVTMPTPSTTTPTALPSPAVVPGPTASSSAPDAATSSAQTTPEAATAPAPTVGG